MTHLGDQGQASSDDPRRHHTVMDVGSERVARIYAEALLRAAEAGGQADEVRDELESLVRDVLPASPELKTFLASAAVGRDQKAGVIRNVFGSRAGELFVNFLLVLNDHERLEVLQPIAAAYRELRDKQAGRMHVLVSSAVPLPDDQKENLKQHLRATFNKEPILDIETDPELLGGMVVRVGDWLYDGSVRAELNSIRDQIIARSSYEIQSGRDRFSSANGN
jgi:F-type H+-transporting ATPase subunit delta